MSRMSLRIDGDPVPYGVPEMPTPDTVCICTPTAGPPKSWEWIDGVFGLKAPAAKMFRHMEGKQGVDEGHNVLIEWFLSETRFKWMLMTDADAILHSGTLLRLLSWDVKFVSALAFERRQPYPPVVCTERLSDSPDSFSRPIVKVAEWIRDHPQLLAMNKPVVLEPRPSDALWEVLRGGAHCCLVHRTVLEAIAPPWFERSPDREAQGTGSDFDFYRKAIEAGFQPYVDMSVVAGHATGDLCMGALDFFVWNSLSKWAKDGTHVDIEVPLPVPHKEE